MLEKKEKLKKRHKKIRARIQGTPERPRLQVFRSLNHTYVQVIDDTAGKTIFSIDNSKEKKGTKTEKALALGESVAKGLKEKGVDKVVFDRKGYLYHGRVKAVAEGARKGGLEF